MKTVWRKLEVQYSSIQFPNSKVRLMHAKFYFKYFRGKKHMISSHHIFLIKISEPSFFFMLETVFNIILKWLFDLLSVHVSVMKKDKTVSTTETSVIERYIGKKLPLQTNFIWYNLSGHGYY